MQNFIWVRLIHVASPTRNAIKLFRIAHIWCCYFLISWTRTIDTVQNIWNMCEIICLTIENWKLKLDRAAKQVQNSSWADRSLMVTSFLPVSKEPLIINRQINRSNKQITVWDLSLWPVPENMLCNMLTCINAYCVNSEMGFIHSG